MDESDVSGTRNVQSRGAARDCPAASQQRAAGAITRLLAQPVTTTKTTDTASRQLIAREERIRTDGRNCGDVFMARVLLGMKATETRREKRDRFRRPAHSSETTDRKNTMGMAQNRTST
jgi:hypothetical protein